MSGIRLSKVEFGSILRRRTPSAVRIMYVAPASSGSFYGLVVRPEPASWATHLIGGSTGALKIEYWVVDDAWPETS